MKNIIFRRNEDGSVSSQKMGSYEGSKDDTSAKRSYLQAEPNAAHLELPEGMDEDCAELVLVEAVEAAEAQGVEGEEGYVPAVAAVPAHHELQESASLVLAKRNAKAQANLEAVRALREPLLAEADHEINTMEDDSIDATAMRAYRKALRSCTDDLKKVNGESRLSCEGLVPSEFVFPIKP
jgi:hypothetical protein